MLRRAAGFTAALGLAALALMPGAAANAQSTVQPDGGGTGWTLVENQGGDGIYADWLKNPGIGGDCSNSSSSDLGLVTNPSGLVDLTTNGTFDNCAEEASPYTIGPTSADPDVFIEYEAWLPQNTWAALWATGGNPWPNNGEIDTAEVLSNGLECSHYHYGTSSDQQQLGAACALGGSNAATIPDEEWIYGVEWSAGQLKFYGDGINWDTFTSSVISTIPEQVVLDNTTGGWEEPCTTCTDSGPESTMVVQYVRVWVK